MEWPLADDELAIFFASHAAGCGGTSLGTSLGRLDRLATRESTTREVLSPRYPYPQLKKEGHSSISTLPCCWRKHAMRNPLFCFKVIFFYLQIL